jgi:hypothetical protein
MSNPLTQKCDICKSTIHLGQKYGVFTLNIETLETTPKYPDGIVEVHESDKVHTMCLNYASKYNNETVKQLLD